MRILVAVLLLLSSVVGGCQTLNASSSGPPGGGPQIQANVPVVPPSEAFIKARLAHFGGTRFGDDHWLRPDDTEAHEWIASAPPNELSSGGYRYQYGYWGLPLNAPSIVPNAARRTLTGSASGYVRLWDSATAGLLWEVRLGQKYIEGLAFLNSTLAAAATDGRLVFFSLKDGAVQHEVALPPCTSACIIRPVVLNNLLFTVTSPVEGSTQRPTLTVWSSAWSASTPSALHDTQPLQTLLLSEQAYFINLVRFINPTTLLTYAIKDEYEGNGSVRLWSLPAGAAPLFSMETQEPFRPVFNQDATQMVWTGISAQNNEEEFSTSPYLLSLSDPAHPQPVVCPTTHVEADLSDVSLYESEQWQRNQLHFSPDQKTLAVASSDGENLTVCLVTLSEERPALARTHTVPALPDDTEEGYELYDIVLTSSNFSADNKTFTAYFDHMDTTGAGMREAFVALVRSESITLDVASGKTIKNPKEASTLAHALVHSTYDPHPDPARIPPLSFAKKHLDVSAQAAFASNDGLIFADLKLTDAAFSDESFNGTPIVWPLQHAPFAVSRSDLLATSTNGALFSVQHKSYPDRSVLDSTIFEWDLAAGSSKVVLEAPRTDAKPMAALSNGDILFCNGKFLPDNDYYYGEYGDTDAPEYHIERFNPTTRAFTAIPHNFPLENCDLSVALNTLNPRILLQENTGNTYYHRIYHMIDLNSGKDVAQLDGNTVDWETSPKLSTDGQLLVFSSRDGENSTYKVNIFDIQTQSVIFSSEPSDIRYRYVLSPTSRYLMLINAYEYTAVDVKVFDVKEKKLLHTIPIEEHPQFSPGDQFLIRHKGNKIDLCDPNTLKVLFTLEGHTAPVVASTFSGDNKTFFSVQDDGTTLAWDWPAIAKAAAPPSPSHP